MGNTLERRTFLKAAGATTSFMIAEGASAFSYAQNSKVRVGCIGVGGQGTFHIREGLTHNPDIQIIALADVYKRNQDAAINLVRLSNTKQYLPVEGKLTQEQIDAAMAMEAPKLSYDYCEVLANPDVDAVVISTPPYTHYEITMSALEAGKFIFCEKTLVRSIEEGRALIAKCHELKRWVQVGHPCRYNPKYNLAQSMVYDQGKLGRITHISAQWHRNTQWRRPVPRDYELNEEEKKYITDLQRHFNWRLYEESSGGLYTELATHQTDVANWFLRAVPSRVCAHGGLDYWRDGRTVDDNIVIVYEYDMKPDSPGFIPIKPRTTATHPAGWRQPTGADLLALPRPIQMDEDAANMPYTVRFVYTSILSGEHLDRSEFIQGDRGSLKMTEDLCRFYQETHVRVEEGEERRVAKARLSEERFRADPSTASASADDTRDCMVGNGPESAPIPDLRKSTLLRNCTDLRIPDAYQFQAFTDCIANGGVPLNNQMVGFTAALTAIAALESRKTGRTVEIDPAWYRFDFEVPSFFGHDAKWSEKACDENVCHCCGRRTDEFMDAVDCPGCGKKMPREDA
jgi:predicted dehydrogenase